jgi:hypothetical protein
MEFTEEQVKIVYEKIKELKEDLESIRRKLGGYYDHKGIRYKIFELYYALKDYKGILTYKRWFDKNIHEDSTPELISLFLAIACHETEKPGLFKRHVDEMARENSFLIPMIMNYDVRLLQRGERWKDYKKLSELTIDVCKKELTASFKKKLVEYVESPKFTVPLTTEKIYKY